MAAQKDNVKTAEKGKTSKFLTGVKAEMRKVIWPTKKELTNYTGVVIMMSVLAAALVGVLDVLINGLLSFIIG
ncbi:MAG: preprotein translocase subunit SecE [Tissierellia bacterium]|nr:preprotein translocase subunit SecE [Tissierellia bacterium]